ncbi:GntR family transcriptional regulator [Pikeienuella piscinae]|uniref:GntR family transcriptional regulator n=1 Tax=Pikeienuella piscinae TaxID=2748098 RepID=A0A7L5BU47_9RHOB|nr:GntR family transcriptional regulator [Pikeienuella piscinae]QIE55092.1 GntR family transcriptional regulator [Pikeienuella piscinae]
MTSLKPVSGQTLSYQVEEQLRAFIFSGAVRPSERMTETALASRLKVSRGPLREAIFRLIEDGLIVKEAYKSIRVRPTSVKELRELTSMRLTLESFAFRQAWDKRTDADLAEIDARCARLVAAVEGEDRREAILDREVAFHGWVFEMSGHSLLLASWRSLTPLLRFYLSIHQQKFGFHAFFAATAKEYSALARGDDLEAMQRHLRGHLEMGLEKVVRSFDGDAPEDARLEESQEKAVKE